MTNLFSVFDPAGGCLNTNWVSFLLFIIIIPISYWLFRSRYWKMWNMVMSVLYREFYMLLGSSSGLGVMMLVLGLFILIGSSNLLGLFPYVFTATGHFSITMSLALPLWAGLMCFGWARHTTEMLAHLVPQGTPSALLVFMVLIESVSNIIRPFTLAVRLGANMIAGHLLLVLLGGQGGLLGVSSVVVVMGQFSLLVLEVAVALIQAYVFVTLMVLYYGEVGYDKTYTHMSHSG